MYVINRRGMCVRYRSDSYILNAGETNGNGSSSAVLSLNLLSGSLEKIKEWRTR